jgi:hypothetical protein
MGKSKAKRILDQVDALDKIRAPQESIWEDLSRICFPRSSSLFEQAEESNSQADRGRMAENFDGTAMRACNTLATGQAARITPMGARWFVLRPPKHMAGNPTAENYYWKATETLTAKLASSNFYNRAFECYKLRGGFGISALETTAGEKGRGLHFSSYPVKSFSIAENSRGEVDTVSRTRNYSPAQMMGKFGAKDPNLVPKKVRDLYDKPETRHLKSETVCHLVKPRDERDPTKIDAKNKPVESCYVHKETESILLESGFDSHPISVSRWETNAWSPYGWAPADYALPEAAQANFQEQMLDVLAETAAFPRVLYPAGMKDEIAFEALGLTSFDPDAGEHAKPQEWLTQGRYDIGKDRAADKKKAIEDAFFVELFNAVSRLSPSATATQVDAILGESRELFHPIYSNMVREFHTPVLRRAFSLLLAQGEIEPPPTSIIEQDDFGAFIADPEVEYVSVMAMALEQTQLAKFNDLLSVMAPLAQADPRFLQGLDPEFILPHFLRLQGMPSGFNMSEEKLAELKQQQQQQQAAEQIQAASQAVRNVGGPQEAAKAAEAAQAAGL